MNFGNHNQFLSLDKTISKSSEYTCENVSVDYCEEKYSISDNTFFTKAYDSYLIVNTSTCECIFTDKLQSEVFELITKATEYFDMIDIIADKLSLRDKKLYLSAFVDKFIEKLLNKGIIIPSTNKK